MQLGREDVYGYSMEVLRFNPKEENARFTASDITKGLYVGEEAILIQGDFSVDGLGETTSVFGLKEDGTPFITFVNELEIKEVVEEVIEGEDTIVYVREMIILKGSPRIVHKGELKVNTIHEEADINDVFSERVRLGVGYNNEGDVIVAAPESAITVKQLGQLMLGLGCTEAIHVYGKGVGKIEYKGIPAEAVEAKVVKKPTNTNKKNKKK